MPSLKDYTNHPEREAKEHARKVRQETAAKKKLSEEKALRESILARQLQRGSVDFLALERSILDNVTFNVNPEGELIRVTSVDTSGVTLTLPPGCWSRTWRGTEDCASI